ncbi:MAG: hypothetical protein CMJ46_07695, partial [Planctomyces sp.]|nr:hypothetical protein [Planctomyces sp.]
IFLLSLLASGITLAFVFYRGEEMSALSIVMPPLVQVLAVSGGIHLVNYYYEALRDPAETEPAKRCFYLGWLPCLLSAGTTAVGLFSLAVSELTPIRNFGIDAGTGVLITTALILAFVPGYFYFFPLRTAATVQSDSPMESPRHQFWSHFWWELTSLLQRVSVPVIFIALIAMAFATRGLQQLETSVRIETLFDGETPVLQDYAWIEEHVGPVVSLELLLDFDATSPVSTIERYRLLARAERLLEQRAEVGATLSALEFLPQAHQSPQMSHAEYDLQLQQILEQSRPRLVNSGYLHQNDEGETFRVTAFVSAIEPIDYGTLLEQMKENLREELYSSGYSQLNGVSMRYAGIMPLVHEIQRQLMEDLFASFVSVFAVITIVMTIVQGGLLTGLVAMIPNLFPILLVFGIIGWRGIAVDIGSMMTASVALGVAVDDTLHYLTFFRRGLSNGLHRQEAVNYAYHHCGRAMMQTTLICGLGLLIFGLSDFVPTSRFAWMMLYLLFTALVGDLLLLPALLLSPLGRLFEPSKKRSSVNPET